MTANGFKNGASKAWQEWIRWGANAVLIPAMGILIWMFVDVQVMKSNRWSSDNQMEYAQTVAQDESTFRMSVWRAIDSKATNEDVVEKMDNVLSEMQLMRVELAELRTEMRLLRQSR